MQLKGNTIKSGRLPFVALAVVSLLVGLGAGLSRIGWSEFAFPGMIHHGGIMVGGFLGTLITLEKIIPLKNKWLYIFPVLSACSVAAFLANQHQLAFPMLVLSSAGLSLTFLIYLLRNRSLIYLLMFLGGICWLTGNILMIVQHLYPVAVGWWMAFALLIISAERIELMKFLPVSSAQKIFFALLLMTFVVGCVTSFHGIGAFLAAFSMISCALWLMKFDVIGITLKRSDLPKFTAVALLLGYISMLITGVLTLTLPAHAFAYDIFLHTFFIGFVFSMIFAHGPIILPGVIGSSVKPYHPFLYAWLFVLHASWLIRAVGGLTIEADIRKISGIISAIGITGYFITLATLTVISVRALKSAQKRVTLAT